MVSAKGTSSLPVGIQHRDHQGLSPARDEGPRGWGGPLSATDTLLAAPLPRGLCSWVLTWRRCRPCLVQRAGLIEGLSPTSTSSSLHQASLSEQLRPVSQYLAVAEPSHFFSPDTAFSHLPSGRTCHWYGPLGGGAGETVPPSPCLCFCCDCEAATKVGVTPHWETRAWTGGG